MRIYIIVRLHESCGQDVADFIVDVLWNKAGLKLFRSASKNGGLILHLTADDERVLEIAEVDLEVKKRDKDGIMREFKRNDDRFENTGLIGPLTLSDVHRCVLYAMESVHFDDAVKKLPGTKLRILKGSSVLAAYREAGLIESFPVHDEEELTKLYAQWKFNKITDPPVEEIRDYFGENVALYYSFTAFYTSFLIPMAILGVFQFVLDRSLGVDLFQSNILFALINLISVTVFLEFWKRRSNEHAYDWGTSGKLRHKRPRPEFRGTLGINEVTGKEEIKYPVSRTFQKAFFVSFPVTFACLALAFALMLVSFESERVIVEYFRHSPDSIFGFVAGYVPTVIYSVIVMLFNRNYLFLAHHLTEWENHRTQEQFERWVVVKLILFEFVNTFLALFYIAFFLGDIPMLKSQVTTMLITTQIVNQVQETILPIYLRRPSTKKVIARITSVLVKECRHDPEKLAVCPPFLDNPEALKATDLNLKRDPYESTYDDFMELWLQFGHVFLFSSVYPLAAFWALINNFIELKMDSYKMCKLMRKPQPRAVRDIGAWYFAFSFTSVISVMTNLTLLAMDRDVQAFAPDLSTAAWILLFVTFEHVFLLIRLLIDKFIPDVPSRVKLAIDKDEFYLKNRKTLLKST